MARNADICIPFASIDPHKGKLGAREARDLIENFGVRGFKFHHIMQGLDPADRTGYSDVRSGSCAQGFGRDTHAPASNHLSLAEYQRGGASEVR